MLQRHARTLHALADRWSTVEPSTAPPLSPFAGADDLNDAAALQLEGVLFMEGEGEPAELTRLIRDLRAIGRGLRRNGRLARQRDAGVVGHRRRARSTSTGLEDFLGDRHRIIANDWLAADMSALVARLLARAADILEQDRLLADRAARRSRRGPVGPRRSCTPPPRSSTALPICAAIRPGSSTTTSADGARSGARSRPWQASRELDPPAQTTRSRGGGRSHDVAALHSDESDSGWDEGPDDEGGDDGGLADVVDGAGDDVGEVGGHP